MAVVMEIVSIMSISPLTTLDVKLADPLRVLPCNNCPKGRKPEECPDINPSGPNSTQPHCRILQQDIVILRN